MRGFSPAAKGYVWSTLLAGGLLSGWWLQQLPAQLQAEDAWLLILAWGLAALLEVLSLWGAAARSRYSLSWIVYGYVLLQMGPVAALVTMLAANVVTWIGRQERPAQYRQLFNMAALAIATTLAGLLLQSGSRYGAGASLDSLALTLASLALFTLSYHLLVGFLAKLRPGQFPARSAGAFTVMLDFTLLCLGLLGALLWEINRFALLLLAFVVYLLYEALKVPALARQAETDGKTGLFNAAYFTRALEEELARATRFRRPLTLVMADLDLLRHINNNYGHLAGDAVLEGVAECLQEAAGEYDIVARFGGEEFAILMTETAMSEAMLHADRLRQTVEETTFTVATSVAPVQVTMSFGVASLNGERCTAEELIHQADIALYRAKDEGRNRVAVYGSARDRHLLWARREEAPLSRNGHGAANNGHRAASNGYRTAGAATATAAMPRRVDRVSEGKGESNVGLLSRARLVNAFVAALVVLTALLVVLLTATAPPIGDWPAFLLFALLTLIAEYLAVGIRARETTVSTATALLIAGVFLFGPFAAIVMGPLIAVASFSRQRPGARTLLFNAGNQTASGLLLAGALLLRPFGEGGSLSILLVSSALAAALVFGVSTGFLSGLRALSQSRSWRRIWIEESSWLAPTYGAMGLVAAGLVYSYERAGLPGILFLAAPLFLLRHSQQQYLDKTASMVVQLREANEGLLEQAEEIATLNEELLLTLARSVDLRDPYVMEHSKNVARYASYVAEELQLPAERREVVRKAALLHDVGKLGIPERVLFKGEPLTEEEYEMVKRHAEIGAELIHGCHSLHGLISIVRHHHEWYDGTGYPDGLAGEEIPLEARILALADAVEAMASDRPYRRAMTPQEIVEEIRFCAGRQFDPTVTEAFDRVVRRRGQSIIVNSAREALRREASGLPLYLS